MGKIIAYTLCLVALLGCNDQSNVNQKVVPDTSKGIIYDTANGMVTDVYDSTPTIILADSTYHKYVCDKINVYAGATSRTETITYKKTYLGDNLVKFEVVGKTCKVIN